jgi:hypothetical protein
MTPRTGTPAPVEDLLRAATLHAAAEIHPGSIAPLDIESLTLGRAGRSSRPAGRARTSRARFPRILVPLAGAAAVVIVAGLSVTLPHILAAHRSAAHGYKPASAAAGSVTGPTDSVPPLYATLTGTVSPWQRHPMDIDIRQSSTGRVIARVAPPAPYKSFSAVLPGKDDSTWVVGAQPWQPVTNARFVSDNSAAPVTLFLLHVDPATGHTSFTKLPVPAIAGDLLQGVALSPGGAKLAVATGQPGSLSVSVYDLPARSVRTWSVTGTDAKGAGFAPTGTALPGVLSWLSNGQTLAFNWGGKPAYVNDLRTLDTAQPGGDLLSDSRQFFTVPGNFGCQGLLTVSPDGTTVTCGGTTSTASLTPPITYGFAEFSVSTGKLLTVLHPVAEKTNNAPEQDIFYWDGTILIGDYGSDQSNAATYRAFALNKDSRTQVIPWRATATNQDGSPMQAAW